MTAEVRATDASSPAPTVWDRFKRALSPAEERPRLVAGIEVAHHVSRAGLPYVMVRNPAASTYVKLDPREYDLLGLMDGTRAVKALAVAYYQRHGVLALPQIAGLIRLLRSQRFLAEAPIDAYGALGARLHGRGADTLVTRVARGFLESQIALGGVDGWLDAWYRAWGWLFFTRPTALIGSALGILGPVLLLFELGRSRYEPLRVGESYALGLVLFGVLEVFTLALHELGHGLAVKHAGRFVPRAGLMIYYGMPAAFVDTTDVWMAPRRMRLLASLAGPWTGLVMGGICALTTVLLPQGPLGELLFTWSLVFLLNTLLNFNPLLELDGYYVLVDLLEKPMLRPRALAFVRGPLWSKLRRREPLTGEQRFFALFGLASAGWSVVAVLIALGFWQLRLVPMVGEVWSSENPLAQLGLIVATGLVLAPIALAAWGWARRLGARIAVMPLWLSGRIVARRHHEALAVLRSVPLWADLPDARLLAAARAMRAQTVTAGTEVVRQGEPGTRFYVIASGAFEVLVNGTPVTRLRRGDYFGERALLNDAPRAATVVATESSRVYWLDRQVFSTTLAHDLDMRARLDAALAYREQVAGMPLFRDLSPTHLDLLLGQFVLLMVEEGQDVVRQGDPGDRFYVILEGTLEVERDGHVLAALGPGEAFGEIALLLDVPRTATVRARDPVKLLTLSEGDFHDLLANYLDRADDLERLSHLRLAAHKRLDELAASVK